MVVQKRKDETVIGKKIIFALLITLSQVIGPSWVHGQDYNLMLILVDDLGKEWVGCSGGDGGLTPNIDKLATEGMRFENFYCMPQCTPTRVTLLTGQYPFRHGWVNHWDVPRWGGGCSFDPKLNPCFPRDLREHGWKTVAAGKWQIDDFRQEPDAMVQAGFDHYCMWTGYEAGNPVSGQRYQDPYIFCDGVSRARPDAFGPDVFTDYLVNFIDQHASDRFFMYYPMVLTHSPLVATPADPQAKTKLGKHRAMVRYTDRLVGRLMSALERNKIRDRTIVIFTTDNGTARNITGRISGRPISGGKSKTLESGICVPFIASCPGTIPEGVVSKALVDITDLSATFSDIAKIPNRPKATHGRSFRSVLFGESTASPRQWIMSMGGGNHAKLTDAGVENQYWFRDRVLRNDRYKIYINSNREAEKMVDLRRDPEENLNILNSATPEIAAARRLFMKAVDQMPTKDADPRYQALPQREWFLIPDTPSQIWKTGRPNNELP